MTNVPPKDTWSISELARELGISARSIRFYEEKGLISPGRSQGGYRVYEKRDRARLKLILRGKRFGLSLDECAEILGLATVDLDEAEQIKKALAYGERAYTAIMSRKAELEVMARDMLEIRRRLTDRLAELEGRGGQRAKGRRKR